MSSLNQAFIKAYGREATSATTETAPPQPVESAPAAPTLANWYSADTWYRAEAAAAAPVAAPHASFPGGYQAPSPADLSRLSPSKAAPALPGEPEYRLSPPEAVPLPEVIVFEEPPPAPVTRATPTTLPPRVLRAPEPSPPAAVVPPVVAPDLSMLFVPMQVTADWETSLGYLPAVTTAGPVPVVSPTIEKAATRSEPAAPAPVEVKKTPAPEAKVNAPSAPPTTSAPVAQPPVELSTPRLDAAVTAPVPKPHASFAAAESATALKLKIAETATAPPPPPAEKPEPAPLGLLQPAWEVDRFQWPDHCRQLLATENAYLADVGARLSNAARDGLSILAVTSTRRSEGRTTLALCLARAAADAGVKVALVDADIENPQLVNELGVEASCGWHDAVLGKQPLSEAAIVSVEDKFAFFPWTSSSGLKSLNDPRVTRVLRDIAKAYSLVILDLGPVPGRETRLFEDGDHCPVDAAILVRDLRWTSALEAQRVAAHLTAAGVASVGIAENFGPRAQQAA